MFIYRLMMYILIFCSVVHQHGDVCEHPDVRVHHLPSAAPQGRPQPVQPRHLPVPLQPPQQQLCGREASGQSVVTSNVTPCCRYDLSLTKYYFLIFFSVPAGLWIVSCSFLVTSNKVTLDKNFRTHLTKSIQRLDNILPISNQRNSISPAK